MSGKNSKGNKRPQTLIKKEDVQNCVYDLAYYIREKIKQVAGHSHEHEIDLIIIGVLTGGAYLTIDLDRYIGAFSRKLKSRLIFVHLSSYQGNKKRRLEQKIGLDPGVLRDKHVLIVDDIVETGETLSYLVEEVKKQKPLSIHTAALLCKPDSLQFDVEVDFLGYEINDLWVVGYGMDDNGYHRNLSFVGYSKGTKKFCRKVIPNHPTRRRRNK